MFLTAMAIAACWLLGFVAVALAIGPDGFKARPDEAAIDPPLEVAPQSTELDRLRTAAAILSPGSLAGVPADVAKARALEWADAVERQGVEPLAAIGEILPPSVWFQARLVGKRDQESLAGDAKTAGAYGQAYKAILASLTITRASSKALEAVLDEIWRASGISANMQPGPVPVLDRSERWLPARSSLRSSHQYALDVFFTRVSRSGAEETGPVVRSMSGGIVVSASGDWRGGDKPSLYRWGGLSPNAGNGAIVYSPDEQRYYAYFHLKDVDVTEGQLVEAGQPLGHGGNTGVNARKKGHGTHVHVELHDASGEAWTSYRIRDLILSMH
ncbi:MAG: hypothetical protein CVV51_13315 [Spirochaetae bacterium HGW-Spirochaetae-7]|jgi:murein DD-endopeptidase MepM/ murein hydrolase activator NlpD|nr:MAG: hypothetical protein CVV51_13315 [Spirochaetae bacterium HGW-Spirochaetae-7]